MSNNISQPQRSRFAPIRTILERIMGRKDVNSPAEALNIFKLALLKKINALYAAVNLQKLMIEKNNKIDNTLQSVKSNSLQQEMDAANGIEKSWVKSSGKPLNITSQEWMLAEKFMQKIIQKKLPLPIKINKKDLKQIFPILNHS